MNNVLFINETIDFLKIKKLENLKKKIKKGFQKLNHKHISFGRSFSVRHIYPETSCLYVCTRHERRDVIFSSCPNGKL